MTDREPVEILNHLGDAESSGRGLLFSERYACRHALEMFKALQTELAQLKGYLSDRIEDHGWLRHVREQARAEGVREGLRLAAEEAERQRRNWAEELAHIEPSDALADSYRGCIAAAESIRDNIAALPDAPVKEEAST